MVEEAFALSPISARASLPSEADYEAIREAFMETSRGRWFLNEYAKRNRTSDTNLVLEAVNRIEVNLGSRKDTASGLIEQLSAIRAAIRSAKVRAAEAMPRPENEPAQKAALDGARIVAEVARTMRDCGADVRICDLLDKNIAAISAALSVDLAVESRKAVLAAFDALVQRVEHIATSRVSEPSPPLQTAPAQEPAAPSASAPVAPATSAERSEASVTPLFRAAPDAPAEPIVAAAPPVTPAATPPRVARPPVAPVTPSHSRDDQRSRSPAAQKEISSAATKTAMPAAATVIEPPAASPAKVIEPVAQQAVNTVADLAALDLEETTAPEAFNAADEAVLDLVAMEMAASDSEDDEALDIELGEPEPIVPHQPFATPARAAPVATAPTSAPYASPVAKAAKPRLEPAAPRPGVQPARRPDESLTADPAPRRAAPGRGDMTAMAAEVRSRHSQDQSLGASLIASGLVPGPVMAVADALAAIRRMSHAERIAFFS